MSEYGLLLRFDVDEPQFARGFEVGRVWALLQEHPDAEITETFHATNAEMLLRVGEALDRPVQSHDLDDTWIEVTFEATR